MYSYKNMVEQMETNEEVVEVDMNDILKQQAESETPAETDAEVRRFMDAVLTDYLD